MDAIRQRWPAIRATLITVFVVCSLIKGQPVSQLTEARFEESSFWQGMTEYAPQETWISLSEAAVATHVALSAPVEWFYVAVKCNQRWNMFSGAAMTQHIMQIEGRGPETDGYELLFRPLDETAQFEADRLKYRRIRASYEVIGSGSPPPAYYQYVNWVAGRVFEARPDLDEVRVRMRLVDRRPPELRDPNRRVWRFAHGVRVTRVQYERNQAALREAGQ